MLRFKTSKSSRSKPRRTKRSTRLNMNDNAIALYHQRVEHKFTDTTVTQYATQTGTLTGLDYPARGVNGDNRIGDAIAVKHIEVRYIATLTGASTRDTVRLVLFVDQQGYNTPAVTDVLQPAAVGTAFAPTAPYNFLYRNRFKVLHETLFSLTTAISTYSSRVELPTKFTTTFAGASTFMNEIYWLIISDEGNPAQYPIVNASFRVIYTDQ